MALKRKLQIILDSVAPEIHNLWLRPIDDLRWELNFFNGSIWRPLDISYFRIEDRDKLDYVFEFVDTLTPDHFGLGEVDNTSDLNKPISIATQTALNHKLNTPSPGRKETGVDAGVFGELSIDGEFLYFCTQSGDSSTAVWVPLQSAEDIATALSEAISDHQHSVEDITDIGDIATINKSGETTQFLRGDGTWQSPTFSEIGSHPTTLSGYGITDATPSSHIGATGNAHGVATSEINGFMSTDDKVKLTNIAENANNYSHPTGDGNLHVPETGTTNNGKVLKAGGTAGSISWENDIDTITSINGKTGAITKEDITALGIPAQDTVYIHPDSHPATIITQTSDYRFVTDTEKGVWNDKENLSNKVTSIDGASTDIQYPSAKVVYNKLAEKENLSNKLTSAIGINSAATDLQYPSARAVFDALTEVITNFVTSTPEGVREDIAELEADFPTGATGIWIVKDTGHWYFYAAENWIDGGLYQSPLDVVQTTGTSETDVMSQKAVTDEIAQLAGDVKDTTEKPTAQSLAELNARLLALEKIVSSSLRSTIEVTREFNVWGKTNLNLSGNGAPAFAPDFIGQRYTDITGQNVYDAVGTTTAGDWKLS